MTANAIETRGLTKEYLVGGSRAYGYTTLRERLTETLAARRSRGREEDPRLLRALDDVTLDIAQGETLGFIGHNGAGKTTLLKLLSRVTPPTRGYADVRGRVGSLLEVGTGFHPELTGRENIFLNGAILGMTREEIRRRYDDIVAFAEVERFLDTPVKRYSSGMFVRLAFSVAAHLEPEILIVDEVLAVGDAAFQRKCLERMSRVASEGRTVLLVSHNMAVVQALCRRAVLLERGRVIEDGDVQTCVAAYLRGLEQLAEADLTERRDRRGWQEAVARRVAVRGSGGGPVATGAPAEIEVELTARVEGLVCQLQVCNAIGNPVMTFNSGDRSDHDDFSRDDATYVLSLPALPLLAGRYRIDITIWGNGHLQDDLPAAAYVDVGEGVVHGRPAVRRGQGDVSVEHVWNGPDL